jgi:hypothetical protein
MLKTLSFLLLLASLVIAQEQVPTDVVPVDKPDEVVHGQRLRESSSLIRAKFARLKHDVDGSGLAVAVIDTGVRSTHIDFGNRIVAQKNFVNGTDNAWDDHGHGTHVSGIILADSISQGIAPGAKLVSLKALDDTGFGYWEVIDKALKWVLRNKDAYNITVVNMSIGDSGNYTEGFNDFLSQTIKELRAERIAVTIAAGNNFKHHESKQGMSFPANCPSCVSVGAVYDANLGIQAYWSGAAAFSTGADRITPFSQRLHWTTSAESRTDIFAPGARVTSTGYRDDYSMATMSGTSMAAPMTAGTILLIQQLFLRKYGELPSVDMLESILMKTATIINDGDDEDDNVENTGLDYPRGDALAALDWISGSDYCPNDMNIYSFGARINFREGRDDFYGLRISFLPQQPDLIYEIIINVGHDGKFLEIGPYGRIKEKGISGRFRKLANGKAVLSIRITQENLDNSWEKYGIENKDAKDIRVTLPVSMIVQEALFVDNPTLYYSSKRDIMGRVRLAK